MEGANQNQGQHLGLEIPKAEAEQGGQGAPPPPLDSPESPVGDFRPVAAAAAAFTDMLRSKLVVKSGGEAEGEVVGGGRVGKVKYTPDMLRKMCRDLITNRVIADWPESIGTQYNALAKRGPRMPTTGRVKREGFSAGVGTPQTQRTAPAPSSSSSSTEIPAFEFRVQVSKSKGFAFLLKPAPSTETYVQTFVFKHRMPWKSFSEVKCIGTWELTTLRKANKDKDETSEWLVKSATPGGSGMVKWLDGDDNVLCSFTLRVQNRKFVVNSCADGSWGREEFFGFPEGQSPGGGRPGAAGAGGGTSASGGALSAGRGGAKQQVGGASAQQSRPAARERDDLWDSQTSGLGGDLSSLSGAGEKQRALFEKERKQFETELKAHRKAGSTTAGSYHADSDALLDSLIEEDTGTTGSLLLEEDDERNNETFSSGAGVAAPLQAARKVSVKALFGGAAGTVGAEKGPNIAAAFGSGLFSSGGSSGTGTGNGTGAGAGAGDDMSALYGDLTFDLGLDGGMEKSDSWLTLPLDGGEDIGTRQNADVGGLFSGLGTVQEQKSQSKGPFTSILGAALATGSTANSTGVKPNKSLGLEDPNDDADIDLSMTVPSWSPGKLSHMSPASPATPASPSSGAPVQLSLSALFNAAKSFDGPSGGAGSGAVSRDESGQLLRGAPLAEGGASTKSFDILSKLGFENGNGNSTALDRGHGEGIGNSPATPASAASFAFHSDVKSPTGPIKNLASTGKGKAGPAISNAAKMALMQKQIQATKSPAAQTEGGQTSTTLSSADSSSSTTGMKKIPLSKLFGSKVVTKE